jgi:PPK2 family polyphosphate:nucleotide phosphotransferase
VPHTSDHWLVTPGEPFHLKDVDPGSTPGVPGDREKTLATFAKRDDALIGWQERLWAEHQQSLLIVLQAIDGGGKDGTIEHVLRGMNPQGVRVAGFKTPTEEEKAHDFLWRVHKVTPGKGEVGVFNRSHYEDVIITRVHNIVPPKVWRARYDHINAFERNLADAGTRIVKFFLHISKDEQAARLRARIEDPTKQWKFRAADLEDRKLWDDFQAAFQDAITHTSTETAPWYVIPADKKWYRNWAVSEVLLDVFAQMKPNYPPPEDDLSKIVIE